MEPDFDTIKTTFVVTPEQWDALQELLEAPPEPNPKLVELLSRPTIFDKN